MAVKEDIKIARSVMNASDSEHVLFNDSSYIYKCTNEFINSEAYQEQMRNKIDILSVIGSGDQILNSILLGSENIDAFDISRFPKYFLGLKIAAVKVLTYDEFLEFFFNGNRSFSRRLYRKVVDAMSGELKEFWEKIASTKLFTTNYTPRRVYISGLFLNDDIPAKRAIQLNPYLNPFNYQLLKKKIENARISYLTGNIMHLGKQLDKSYDFVNLSNIYMYQMSMLMEDPNCQQEERYKHFIRNLKINPGGSVLNYLRVYSEGSFTYTFVKKYYDREPDFHIYPIPEGAEEGFPDALLVYKK